ncbi:thiamine biosynthesis protein ThiS [PVC group bacterium (ex Bugula neritina AB1)]|nr:thiamine biosynthesis protein ThiS [PVC group bacterium (ex Bugula neritina AB1)]
MQIKINGEDKTLEGDKLTVIELLKKENVDMPDMVSVELNGAFLDREKFETTHVVSGDKVEFLYFMGGGQR